MKQSRFIIAALLVLASNAPALAAPAPTATPGTQSVMLGRKNPFRPLVTPRRIEIGGAPFTPISEVPPLPAPEPTVRPALSEFEFRGVAYDQDEALAATQIDGKLRFLRVGDRVAGATLVSIASDRIVLRKNGRLLTKRLPSP